MQAYEFLNELLVKLKNHYDEGAYRPNPYRASSAGECARKLAFTKLYPEVVAEAKDLGPRDYSIFALGNLLHDAERDLYEAVGYEVTDREALVEVKMLMDDMSMLNIRGKIDGKIKVSDTETVLFDIKTAGNGGFNKARSMGIPYSYKCQAQLYLDALNLDYMWFIYYNKDTSDRMVLEYASDQNISNSVRNRFAAVYNTTDETNAPSPEFFPYRQKKLGKLTGVVVLDPKCAQCPFKEKCYPAFQLNAEKTHYVTTSDIYTGPYLK